MLTSFIGNVYTYLFFNYNNALFLPFFRIYQIGFGGLIAYIGIIKK
jgi:hypothetical protein